MLDNHKSIPLLIGVSILFLIPIAIGGFTYTALQEDSGKEQTPEAANSQPDGASPAGLARETVGPRPMQSPPNRGTGGGNEALPSNEGIPTGKYSNPPAKIESGGVDLPGASRPIDDFDSSVERNKLNQESIDTMTPDYSAPSSSNNFNNRSNDFDDNSLITPLEEDDFLEVPESDDEETPTLSPVGDPSTQP